MPTFERTPLSEALDAFAEAYHTSCEGHTYQDIPSYTSKVSSAWNAIYQLDEAYSLTLLPYLEEYKKAAKRVLFPKPKGGTQ